jgi:hypothetical protein
MTTWKPVLPALKQIFVPGSGSAFVAVASTAKLDPDLRRRLLPTNSLNVVLELVEELKKGDQVPSEVKDLRFLSVMSTAIRADWTTHFQQAHKRLMEDFVPSNIRGEYVRGVRTPLLVLAVHVGTDERAKALARDLVQQEVFSHIISFSRANGYWSELARCVAVLIGVDDVLDSSIASLQIPENHVASLERELAMVLEHSFTPGQIFGLSFATFGMPGTIGGILVKVLATLSDAASRVP